MLEMKVVKNTTVRVIQTFLFISISGYCIALAADQEEEEVPENRHAIGVFVGATHAHDEYLETLGLEFGYFLSKNLEIGALIERAVREDDSTLVIAWASYRVFGNFSIGAGVGRKDPGPDRQNTLRLFLAYDHEINERWSLEPQFAVDFIEDEENEEVLGIAIVRRF